MPLTTRSDQGVIQSLRGGRKVCRPRKLQGRVESIDRKHIMVNERLHRWRTGPVVSVGTQEKVVFDLLSKLARKCRRSGEMLYIPQCVKAAVVS